MATNKSSPRLNRIPAGSSGCVSYSMLRIRRTRAALAGKPRRSPSSAGFSPSNNNQPQERLALRAQRQADTELDRSLSHEVRQHAV